MDVSKLQMAFEKKGYQFRYFAHAAEAAAYLDRSIDGKTVGFGDSHTLYDMNLYALLRTHNDVRSPMHLKAGESFDEAAKECICNAMVLHLHKLSRCDAEVVVIGQELGF